MSGGKSETAGFRVFWSPEDQEWVAVSEAYPSLSRLADTPDGALLGIIELHRQVALDVLASESQELGLE